MDAIEVAGLTQGVVLGVVAESVAGRMRCDIAGTIREVSVLVSSGLPLAFEVGDTVLVWAADEGVDPVVLGRVEDGSTRPSQGLPEKLVIEAGREVTLRVGTGSVSVLEDGRVLLKGKDVVSHAKRLNRIKGGSVAIN